MTMNTKIKIAILEDHLSIIDGYRYRLGRTEDITIVGTINFGEELLPFLSKHSVDVLILDISVPTSLENRNPYPVLYTIPKIFEINPDLKILVITMHNQVSIIKAVLESGVSGYVFKDDRTTLSKLKEVIRLVANGGIYLSQQVYDKTSKFYSVDSMLSSRQLEALSLCASYPGSTATILAEKLGVAPSTMRNLLSRMYKSLNVSNRSEALIKARNLGLITPDEPGV